MAEILATFYTKPGIPLLFVVSLADEVEPYFQVLSGLLPDIACKYAPGDLECPSAMILSEGSHGFGLYEKYLVSVVFRRGL